MCGEKSHQQQEGGEMRAVNGCAGPHSTRGWGNPAVGPRRKAALASMSVAVKAVAEAGRRQNLLIEIVLTSSFYFVISTNSKCSSPKTV